MIDRQPLQGHEQSYRHYRALYENVDRPQSIEAEGIYEPAAFRAALEDPRTSVLRQTIQGENVSLPLMTPLENVDWFNMSYHRRYAGDVPLAYYSHLSAAYTHNSKAYAAALYPGLEQLADANGVVVLDHTETQAERLNTELQQIMGRVALTLSVVPGADGDSTRHYHYASTVAQRSGHSVRQYGVQSLYDAYTAGRQNGDITDGAVSVVPSLSPGDREHFWEFYKPVFDGLTENDPVDAGLTEAEFAELMDSPECAKFVYKKGGTIANVALIMDVRAASWMNQWYFSRRYPEHYTEGGILYSPGIIRNPETGGLATSLRTIGMLGKVIRLSGTEPVLTFACDTESNQNVPGLSQAAFERANLSVNYARLIGRQYVPQPIDHQVFRMFRVTR